MGPVGPTGQPGEAGQPGEKVNIQSKSLINYQFQWLIYQFESGRER